MSKRSETSKQVTDARLVSLGELTKLDDLDGGEIEAILSSSGSFFYRHPRA